jgi:hypothetical protein
MSALLSMKSRDVVSYTPDVIMKSGLFACVTRAGKHAARPRENR